MHTETLPLQCLPRDKVVFWATVRQHAALTTKADRMTPEMSGIALVSVWYRYNRIAASFSVDAGNATGCRVSHHQSTILPFKAW